jgi:hypothetical protein
LSEALNIGNEVGLLVGLRDSKRAESEHSGEDQSYLTHDILQSGVSTGSSSAESRAEQERAGELLIKSRELLKKMQAGDETIHYDLKSDNPSTIE